MRKKAIAFLTVLFAWVVGFSALSEARQMDANQALTRKQQGIVTISAFTAKGNMEKLKSALNEGLDGGLAVNEVKEVLIQLYAYTGFPRSLNALGAFMGVVEEREKKGIKDELGREPNPFPVGKSSV